ncbi:MAG: XRE family transcriptional regulator [Alicyclobacillus sp.]|nr:XRE family transcriptional regulator [Alicyclobacillus sp.]
MEWSYIGENLRRIRDAKGLSQQDVADKAGISRVKYSKIERGIEKPQVSTLEDLAVALGVRIDEILHPAQPLQAVRFRAHKKLRARSHILSQVARWLSDYHELESLLNEHMSYQFCDWHAEEQPPYAEWAIKAAKQARHALGLDDTEPIRDLPGLMERAGVKLRLLPVESDGFFGLSVSETERGPAIVVNTWERISIERQIFSVAHELGHLLLHLQAYDVKMSDEAEREEREAGIFASYFLMPDESFRSEWDDTYGLPFVDRVLKVKRIFQVSYKTVLHRLSTTTPLGNRVWSIFQTQYAARNGGRGLTKRDEPLALRRADFVSAVSEFRRAREPESLASPYLLIEDRLARLVRIAMERELITLHRGAEILGMDLWSMREWVASWVR